MIDKNVKVIFIPTKEVISKINECLSKMEITNVAAFNDEIVQKLQFEITLLPACGLTLIKYDNCTQNILIKSGLTTLLYEELLRTHTGSLYFLLGLKISGLFVKKSILYGFFQYETPDAKLIFRQILFELEISHKKSDTFRYRF